MVRVPAATVVAAALCNLFADIEYHEHRLPIKGNIIFARFWHLNLDLSSIFRMLGKSQLAGHVCSLTFMAACKSRLADTRSDISFWSQFQCISLGGIVPCAQTLPFATIVCIDKLIV